MEYSSKDEIEQILEREKKTKIICAQLNNFVELKPTLMAVIAHIKELTNCEAVGVRLHDDGDYPYYVYSGFSESFIKKENSLCSKNEAGNRIPSPDGKGYLLDCMCGNIIRGRFDPSLSFFTDNGSFWSNNTTALLASTSDEDRQSRTRNYCNSCGYESVSLIPIKTANERLGLIQLNDKRIDMFSENLIGYLEMVAEQIGLAVQNSLIHTKLKEAHTELNILTQELQQKNTELTKLNEVKNQFLGMASHDLRRPIGSILTFSEFLLNEAANTLSKEHIDFLTKINTSSAFMKGLVDDFLDVAMIESGKLELDLQPTNLYSLIDNIISLSDYRAKRKQIKIVLNSDENIPVLMLDGPKIEQVVRNLVSNAIDYSTQVN